VNPFRSVGARLSLGLVVIVAAALAIVYVGLVPTLKHRLIDAKVSQLQRAAPVVRGEYAPFDPDFLATAAATVNAQVAVLYGGPLSLSPPVLQILDVSLQSRSSQGLDQLANDPIALRSAASGVVVSGTVERNDERFAEVAVPVTADRGVLLSASLHDTLADVHLVQRRLLEAGGIALLACLVLGFGAAAAFARRIRRLEQAAERIAGGDFSEPVAHPGADELGQLARAFDRMRERLAQLDDARRAFIANASHELRTPLFSLGGFLELLQDEDLDDATRREFLATMHEQVQRLTKLATDLLDLSRLDAGRLHVVSERVDLALLAGELAEEFSAVARSEERLLEVAVEAPVVAQADRERTLQIGRILVENALKHTPPGTPVRVVVRPPAQLVVVDDGPGIPADQAGRVFERFTRLADASASGSGLGLAIARELAGVMGGSISLESEPGRTAFALVLPAAEAAAISRENAPVPVA
jgi:signal transduction histidine kinase